MNKRFDKVELDNGVLVEFNLQGNRYFGDYHRLQIKVIATIPLDDATLPEDVRDTAARHVGFIKYEKTLERMGVATNQVDSTVQAMIDDFIKTVGCYLEKKHFAVYWLRKNMITRSDRNRFSSE
jgi:hypothetical protein